jgi:hypothetical protein
MPGEGSLQRDLRGFLVSDFANQYDVGVLSQNGSQGRGKGESGFFVHLHLDDVFAQPVLHRVFDGDDVDPGALHSTQSRIQRGGLARTGGAGYQDDPFLMAQQRPDCLLLILRQSQGIQREGGCLLVQDPDHHLLPV